MAHTYGGNQTKANASTNPVVSASYTVPAGTTVVVAMLVTNSGTDRAGGAPTYGGVTMLQAGTTQKAAASPETSVELWYLVSNIPTGASTLSIPNTNTARIDYVIATGIAGGGNASALDNASGANGTSTNPAASVTATVAGNIVFAVVGSGAQTWGPSGRSGTQIYDGDFGALGGGAQYVLQAGTGSQATNWTFGTSDDWAICNASFKEVAAPLTLTGSSAVATWTVPSSTLSTVVELSGATAVHTWTVPTGTLATFVELSGASALSSWTVPTASLQTVVELSGASAAATWNVPTGDLTAQSNTALPGIGTGILRAGSGLLRITG